MGKGCWLLLSNSSLAFRLQHRIVTKEIGFQFPDLFPMHFFQKLGTLFKICAGGAFTNPLERRGFYYWLSTGETSLQLLPDLQAICYP